MKLECKGEYIFYSFNLKSIDSSPNKFFQKEAAFLSPHLQAVWTDVYLCASQKSWSSLSYKRWAEISRDYHFPDLEHSSTSDILYTFKISTYRKRVLEPTFFCHSTL